MQPQFPPVWQRLVGFGFCVRRVGSTMQNLRRVGENSDPTLRLKPFVDQSSRNFQAMWEAPCTFQRLFPIVCFTFRSEDIRY